MNIQRMQQPIRRPPKNQIHQYRGVTDQLPQVTAARQSGQASAPNQNPGPMAMRQALAGGSHGPSLSAQLRQRQAQGVQPPTIGASPNAGVDAMRSAMAGYGQQARAQLQLQGGDWNNPQQDTGFGFHSQPPQVGPRPPGNAGGGQYGYQPPGTQYPPRDYAANFGYSQGRGAGVDAMRGAIRPGSQAGGFSGRGTAYRRM